MFGERLIPICCFMYLTNIYVVINMGFSAKLSGLTHLSIFQAAEIERRIAQETKAEQHIHKLLLLGIAYLKFSHLVCHVDNV